jgi:hypothetical protein
MIAYPKGVVDLMGKALDAISGKAILSSGGTFLAKTKLPIDHHTSTNDFDAMVLFHLGYRTVQTVRSIAADYSPAARASSCLPGNTGGG